MSEHAVAAYRRRHGLTMEALGAKVGVAKATIFRIETGEDASLDLIRRLIAISDGELEAGDFIKANPETAPADERA